MKITELLSTIVPVRRRRTLKTVYGESPQTTTVIVRLVTDEGIYGIGQTVAPAPWYGVTAEAIKVAIYRYLKPVLVGENPFAIERLHQHMQQALRAGNYAITAVDIALWDIKGKVLGVPVYELLGGSCRKGAVLHAFVEREEAEATAARVRELYADGWRWFKTKIGFDVAEDVSWYRAVRSAVPEDAQFQLDGNTGYALAQAIKAFPALEAIGGIGLVEQPVRYLDEMTELATRLKTPLQADEALTGPRSVYEIASSRAAHVLHFKIHKYGGLLPANRMAAIAESAGLEISVAPYFDIIAAMAAHFAVATPVARWPAGFSDMEDTLLAEPYLPEGQILFPPTGTGLGVVLDTDKLAYYHDRQRVS